MEKIVTIIASVLLIIMLITMIITQVILFIKDRKSIKLTDEVSKKMLEDLDLTIEKHKKEIDEIIKKPSKKSCKNKCKDDTEVL